MQIENANSTIIYFSKTVGENEIRGNVTNTEVKIIDHPLEQDEYIRLIEEIHSEQIVLVDGERFPLNGLRALLQNYNKGKRKNEIGYVTAVKPKLWMGSIQNLWSADAGIIDSPVFIGTKATFLEAYGGHELAGNTLAAIGYSLQKKGGLRFLRLEGKEGGQKELPERAGKYRLWSNYFFRIPGHYLFSGEIFRHFLAVSGKVQRDMVCRMLFLLFACFTFLFMSYISKDYGVSGDEFVDHRHAGYVLDYFAKGDKAALDQPRTALHLYGNVVQVVTAAICRWFEVDNYYELRHFVGGSIGALGIIGVGLLGLRWGGGVCGLLSLLLMFFTPRFFGHSMNNLKDVPFAVGYGLSLFYTVRLFDYFPLFRFRHVIGLVLGIALALGTRSGGLILYPMLFMYAGLYYIQYYGIKDFYKLKKQADGVGRILQIILLVIVCSYLLAILLWPFALQHPMSNVFYSLVKFTNFSVGLKTIFDGEQMMSNMLPWRYAPKFLCIGMPIVTLIGFFGYILYVFIRRKEFSLISFFLLFAVIFPVFWVIYQHSNLYGGIRHLLFVMLPMVVVAGRFWSQLMLLARKYFKILVILVFLGLLALPVIHAVRNHPNDYIYFNEFRGGIQKAYGDYETDYYFNSLKRSADWFRQNVLSGLPANQKVVVVTQAFEPVKYYFRKDTNVHVIYSRYYEKYSKDWDYAIFGNVYINEFQLKNGLFPPDGTLYTPTVDGYPMSFVLKRETKQELKGFELERARKYGEALAVFEAYTQNYKKNEEVWSKMGKLYFMTGQLPKALEALNHALKLQPALNEALYISALVKMDMKDYKGASQSIEQMLSENSFSADALYLKATLYYNLKNYKEAVAVLNRILSFRPNYDRAHVLAGDIFRDNGDFNQAYQMYNRALKYKNSVNVQVQVADMLIRLKNYKKAEEILSKIAEVQPSYYPVYKVRCRRCLQEGKLADAANYLKAMERISDDAELFVLKALYCRLSGDKENMELMLKQALALDAGNAEALALKKGLK